jgi:formylglycine-generating enzyme required for sulfatase activity
MVIVTVPIEVNSEIKPGKSMNASVLGSAKQQRVGHSFAIATREITVHEFQKFLQENPRIKARNNAQYSPVETCPMNSASWYDTAAYCNWLSKQANIPEGQWCYMPNEKGEYGEGMSLSPDADKKKGYRLPTDAEWELSCSAGATTDYSFGNSWALITKYDWIKNNSPKTTQPVGSLKPNEFGLFDVHGNVSEWCLDKPGYNEYHKLDGHLILMSIRYNERGNGETMLNGISEVDYDRAELNDKIPRLCRGGDFYHEAGLARASARQAILPTNRFIGTGFRPARTYP